MLYLLATVLLFSISFGDNDCNSIVYSDSEKSFAALTGQCQIISGSSFEYVCINGTKINQNYYSSSIDCSGTPTFTNSDICKSYPNSDDCTAICNKNDCVGILQTIYLSNDCSGNILTKINHLPGYCIGNSTSTTKIICNGGQIEINTYTGSIDCSNTPSSSQKLNIGCNELTGTGTSMEIKYTGCDSDDPAADSSCIRLIGLKLFDAIVILFIIFCNL